MLEFLRHFLSFCSWCHFFLKQVSFWPHETLWHYCWTVQTAETFKVIREILTCGLLFKKFIATSSRFFFYNSALQQGFRKTCSGFREGSSFFRGNYFCFSMLMRHYEIFRSLCCIQTPSRPVSYTRGWVQIAEQEILVVCASLFVHCCAVKKNVIAASQSGPALSRCSCIGLLARVFG